MSLPGFEPELSDPQSDQLPTHHHPPTTLFYPPRIKQIHNAISRYSLQGNIDHCGISRMQSKHRYEWLVRLSQLVRYRIMSQFISDSRPYQDNSLSKPNLLTGQLSKIIVRDSASSILKQPQNRHYMQQKISMRFQHEEHTAHLRYNQTLMNNYKKLKYRLSLYGRSKSCKVQRYFEHKSRPTIRESIQQAKKISLKNDSAQRQVVIGRKYSHQLAIKTAMLSEMQQLASIKKRRKQVLNKYFNRSLSCYIGQICQKAAKQSQKNPVLNVSQSKLRKKKKEILFS